MPARGRSRKPETIIRAAKAARPRSTSAEEPRIEVQHLKPAALSSEPLPSGSERAQARATLLQALLLAAGDPKTVLETPNGRLFDLVTSAGRIHVEPSRNLIVSLPNGHATNHTGDVVLEAPDGRLVLVDIVDAHARPPDLKALAFDIHHLKKRHPQMFAALVFVRTRGPRDQDQVRSICYGYDYVFGIDEADVEEPAKFAACKAELLNRFRRGGR